MADEATLPKSWKLIAGRPSLDFVNTVGGRVPDPEAQVEGGVLVRRETLSSYEDLLRWAGFASLVIGRDLDRLRKLAAEDPRRAAAVFSRAVALREALYHVGAAVAGSLSPTAVDLSWLDQEWHEARAAQRLAAHPGNVEITWKDELRLDRVLWPLALDAVDLFTGDRLERLKQCPGEDCGWLFLDTSRNGSRQWCDMRDCGNVAKVRRFRQRQQG